VASAVQTGKSKEVTWGISAWAVMQELVLHDNQLEAIPVLPSFTSLRRFEVSYNHIRSLAPMGVLGSDLTLHEFYAASNKIVLIEVPPCFPRTRPMRVMLVKDTRGRASPLLACGWSRMGMQVGPLLVHMGMKAKEVPSHLRVVIGLLIPCFISPYVFSHVHQSMQARRAKSSASSCLHRSKR
jgi:hypothetical protein